MFHGFGQGGFHGAPPGGHHGGHGCASSGHNPGQHAGYGGGLGYDRGIDKQNTSTAKPSPNSSQPTRLDISEQNITTYDGYSAVFLMKLATLVSGLLLLANFLAAKIWSIGPLILDGGVIVFPVIYACRDVVNEIFGKAYADRINRQACVVNLIGLAACALVNFLPANAGTTNVELSTAFGLSIRVMLSSVIAFWVSGRYNNWCFKMLRENNGKAKFWHRAIQSSIGARLLDTILFNTIAFAGRESFKNLIFQMISAFVCATLLETIVSSRISPIIIQHFQNLTPRANAHNS